MSETVKIIHTRMENCEPFEEDGENSYQYTERNVVSPDVSRHCLVSFYEIPPHKSNYPYHYHLDQEEVFYILSGEGIVKTPSGEKPVKPGDILFFPAGEQGAHKLTNTSDTEKLCYIDFDAIGAMDVAVYPDSGKVGIWGPVLNKVFRLEDKAYYYDGES